MTEPKQVLEWQRMAAEARGRAEGEARGEVKGRAALLVEGLEDRFTELPADLVSAIQNVPPERYRELLRIAMQAASLAHFRDQARL